MKEKMFLSIAIIVMFVMVLYAPATINAITPDNNSIIQESCDFQARAVDKDKITRGKHKAVFSFFIFLNFLPVYY